MIALYCLLWLLVIQCEASKVSPKLDFESTDKAAESNGEISPKIHGVRVIVDTSSGKKSVESRSSEEETRISNKNDNNKKIVGIRTDITFEINDDEKNSTKAKNNDAESIDEDDIVPVYKGYGNGHDPKGYDDNRRWDMINIPVFHGTDDEPRRTGNGGSGDWVRFVPITSVWTTERTNYISNRDYQRRFKPDPNPYVAQKSWKPCLCNNDPAGFKGNTNDVGPVGRRSFVPTTKRVQIDDKLDRTFRDEDKSKK